MKRVVAVLTLVFAFGSEVVAETPKATPADDTSDRISRMERELNGSCSYSISERSLKEPGLVCYLEKLRARCNKIDDCYVYCIGNNVGENVGGGCAHLCNYALREKWSR